MRGHENAPACQARHGGRVWPGVSLGPGLGVGCHGRVCLDDDRVPHGVKRDASEVVARLLSPWCRAAPHVGEAVALQGGPEVGLLPRALPDFVAEFRVLGP